MCVELKRELREEGLRGFDRSTELALRAGSFDDMNFEAEFVVSPPTVDRHGTIFLPSAWEKRLDVYRANPIWLWNHMGWDGSPEDVIGQAVNLRVDEKEGLIVRVRFAVQENEQAALIWRLLRKGYLRAVSHHFGVYGVVFDDDGEDAVNTLPDWARQQLMDKANQCWAVFTDVELRECSVVMLPSSREALVRAAADGEIPWETAARVALSTGKFKAEFFRKGARIGTIKQEEGATVDRSEEILSEIKALRTEVAELREQAKPAELRVDVVVDPETNTIEVAAPEPELTAERFASMSIEDAYKLLF